MEEVLKIQYFGIEYVEKIHDEQIINYGKNGLVGYKDKGQLESVLFNIQNDLYYPTFIDKLTHLIFCLVKFHIFNDGNKRTAIACSSYDYIIGTFIREMENVCIWLAENKFDKTFLKRIVTDIIENTEITEETKLELIDILSKN